MWILYTECYIFHTILSLVDQTSNILKLIFFFLCLKINYIDAIWKNYFLVLNGNVTKFKMYNYTTLLSTGNVSSFFVELLSLSIAFTQFCISLFTSLSRMCTGPYRLFSLDLSPRTQSHETVYGRIVSKTLVQFSRPVTVWRGTGGGGGTWKIRGRGQERVGAIWGQGVRAQIIKELFCSFPLLIF